MVTQPKEVVLLLCAMTGPRGYQDIAEGEDSLSSRLNGFNWDTISLNVSPHKSEGKEPQQPTRLSANHIGVPKMYVFVFSPEFNFAEAHPELFEWMGDCFGRGVPKLFIFLLDSEDKHEILLKAGLDFPSKPVLQRTFAKAAAVQLRQHLLEPENTRIQFAHGKNHAAEIILCELLSEKITSSSPS